MCVVAKKINSDSEIDTILKFCKQGVDELIILFEQII